MVTTVLIAEDDPMMSHLYHKVFTLEGYLVEMAADGQEALDKARQVKPTIIVLDVMMPKLNGLEALSQIKADPILKAIPVVMLTNLAGQQDAETAIIKGAARYIIKSEHEVREVAGIIKEVLNATAASANPTPAVTPPAIPVPTPAPVPPTPTVAPPIPTPPSAPSVPTYPPQAPPPTSL